MNLYAASTWVLPILFAVTLHEAAHGFVAWLLGDDTARKLGRVSVNPLRHVDPIGTVLLPAMLLLARSPFLFGYAKPVPVNFRALRPPRLGMAAVAAAGPATNILLAILAGLAFHVLPYLPNGSIRWTADTLLNAITVNVILAVFNLFPLPPLDGGRILVALLPGPLAGVLARAEPFGMLILLGIFIILPLLAAQTGANLNIVSDALSRIDAVIVHAIMQLTMVQQAILRLLATRGS